MLCTQLKKIESDSGLVVGLFAHSLSGGFSVGFRENSHFHLASTYKLAIAGYALHLVDEENLCLDRLYHVRPHELVMFSKITDGFAGKSLQISLRNLLSLMMRYSDNTATDVIVRECGGCQSIQAWLDRSGIRDVKVNRPTAKIFADLLGFDSHSSKGDTSLELFDAHTSGEQPKFPKFQNRSLETASSSSLDTGTPRGIVQLICKLISPQFLSDQSQDFLKSLMLDCKTGNARLTAGAPHRSRPIAHKSGTLCGAINDVGIIGLPNEDLAIAVFTHGPDGWGSNSRSIAETVIAHVASLVCSTFVTRGHTLANQDP